ncbi:SixA phosphatase family protein [Aureispira anguillae]|uniref:Histidine phosphatase family protein n=1 Tax=Aureispira anguillae TaxID=2864201 RepID=A0A915YIF9_9BACT|nr:histidine phosphatase family protein [Aureispira anguillae]BDS13650.1 histidine phosphatase family protein [Aureispira anguillae]
MKTLYLVRHAKSSWKDLSLKDIDRPLNKRGMRDAPFMGKLMHRKGIFPDKIITSPAKRAQLTAKEFALQLGYQWDNTQVLATIYEASAYDLVNIVQHLDDQWQEVMLFGHNPSYTVFTNFYAIPELDNVPTGAVVAIQFPVDTWAAVTPKNGQLHFFEYPRQYFP